MLDKQGKTKAGHRAHLHIDEENQQYAVRWFDLNGCDMVVLRFSEASEAEAFFSAALKVEEVDVE